MMETNDIWLRSVMEKVNEMTRAECAEAGQLTLGAFIAALEAMPQEAIIRYEIDAHPNEPRSYRGYYDHLAFEYDGPSDTTVGRVLAWARGAMGRTFEGYKGGDFVMHENTPVWAASYGTTSGSRRITGVAEQGDYVVIRTVADV